MPHPRDVTSSAGTPFRPKISVPISATAHGITRSLLLLDYYQPRQNPHFLVVLEAIFLLQLFCKFEGHPYFSPPKRKFKLIFSAKHLGKPRKWLFFHRKW
jgi:hypothetical protein